ncbi:MAG: hypothetical protein AAFW66_08360 [Pseudomonadota bacterium]
MTDHTHENLDHPVETNQKEGEVPMSHSPKDVSDLLLDVSKEFAGWAKHYDTARRALTVLVISVAGGGTLIMMSKEFQSIRPWGLLALLLICGTITLLAILYTRLFYENFGVHKKFRRLASEYLVGTRNAETFTERKIDKWIFKKRLLSINVDLCEENIKGSDEEAIAYLKEIYLDNLGVIFPRSVYLAFTCMWTIICMIYTIFVPMSPFLIKLMTGQAIVTG